MASRLSALALVAASSRGYEARAENSLKCDVWTVPGSPSNGTVIVLLNLANRSSFVGITNLSVAAESIDGVVASNYVGLLDARKSILVEMAIPAIWVKGIWIACRFALDGCVQSCGMPLSTQATSSAINYEELLPAGLGLRADVTTNVRQVWY
jgi:hypothetical protein